MNKTEFTDFINSEKEKGGVRFQVALTTTGEGVMYWTSGEGYRVTLKLCGVDGKIPSGTTRKRIRQYRNWLKNT